MTIRTVESAFYERINLANLPVAKRTRWELATHQQNSYTSYLQVAASVEWKAGEYLAAIAYAFFAAISAICDRKYSATRELGQSEVQKAVQTAFTSLMIMRKHKAFFDPKNPNINGIEDEKAAIEYQNGTKDYKQAIGKLRNIVQKHRDLDQSTAREIIGAIRDQALFLNDVDDRSDDGVPKFIVDGQPGALKVTSYLLKGVPYQENCGWLFLQQLPLQDPAVIQRDGQRRAKAEMSYERFADQVGIKEVQSEFDGIFSSVEEVVRLFNVAYPDDNNQRDMGSLALSDDESDEELHSFDRMSPWR